MGCGGSKLDQNHDEIPPRLEPILQQRLEEIRSKKHDKTSSIDLSTKELIEEGIKLDNQECLDNEVAISNNINPTFHVTQDCPPTLQTIGIDKSLQLSQDQEVTSKTINFNDVDNENGVSKKRTMSLGSFVDEFDFGDYDPSELRYGGSPSFKVYCSEIPYEKDHENLDDGVAIEGQRNSIGQESCCSNDVSVKRIPTKKEKRGRKFKLIPNRGKFLNNMHSFYNFPCSSHNHAHLLQEAPS